METGWQFDARKTNRICDTSGVRTKRLRDLAILCGVILFATWWVSEIHHTYFGSNLHAVVPDKVYRAAQPSPEYLARIVKTNGIRTIVNLRGYCPYDPWYFEEAKATCRLDICQEDINFSAARLPSASEVRRLVEVFDCAEYPLLIHCRRGADRTGLASMVYLLVRTSQPFGTARQHLGLRFGHVPMGRPARMARFFELYRMWLAKSRRRHSPRSFRHWVMNEYRGGACRARFEVCHGPTQPVCTGEPLAVHVRVRNCGSLAWRMNPHKNAGIHLIYRLRNMWGEKVDVGWAGLFDRVVPPGESLDLSISIAPIAKPGRYRLILDMADGQDNMFYQFGSEPLELRLHVEKSS